MIELPPPIIGSAKLLMYARNDADVEFTDQINLFIGRSEESEWKRLGEVENLAISASYNEPGDILLDFCNDDWESQGTIAFTSIEEAKIKAERGYKGISDKWVMSTYSEEEIKDFLRDEYEVDPNSEWWKSICSFCKNESSDSKRSGFVKGARASICGDCVYDFYSWMSDSNIKNEEQT